jgi:hypothetical protein
LVKTLLRGENRVQIVRALAARGGLADLLHGRQQQPDQDRDDGDDDEQFDQSES